MLVDYIYYSPLFHDDINFATLEPSHVLFLYLNAYPPAPIFPEPFPSPFLRLSLNATPRTVSCTPLYSSPSTGPGT